MNLYNLLGTVFAVSERYCPKTFFCQRQGGTLLQRSERSTARRACWRSLDWTTFLWTSSGQH